LGILYNAQPQQPLHLFPRQLKSRGRFAGKRTERRLAGNEGKEQGHLSHIHVNLNATRKLTDSNFEEFNDKAAF
jgi:hypothetical protein